MPTPMNLQRFSEFMDKNLQIIETETIYFEGDEQKYAHLNLASVWDDGFVYQIVIHVDAGPLQKFVGYASSADEKIRQFGESSAHYRGLEDCLSQAIRSESMYGDNILPKLEASPDEIVWRYPEPGEDTPRSLEELYELKDKKNIWFSSDFQPPR